MNDLLSTKGSDTHAYAYGRHTMVPELSQTTSFGPISIVTHFCICYQTYSSM